MTVRRPVRAEAEAVRLRDLRPASWRYALRRTLREALEDDLIDTAASLTYFAVLSVFPALLAGFALIALSGEAQQAATGLLQVLGAVLPAATTAALRPPIEALAASTGAPVALLGGALLSLYSASGYVTAFARAMNRVWEVQEGRPYGRRKLQQIGLTLAIVVLAAATATAAIASRPLLLGLADAVGLGPVAVGALAVLRWPLLVVAGVLLLVVLYAATPNVRRPAVRWLGPGGLSAIVLVVAASLALSGLVRVDTRYGSADGSLVGVVLLLLWLWIANLAVLLGAELDTELQRVRRLQAGVPAADGIGAVPRSTAAIDRRRTADAREAAAGEALAQPPAR